MWLKFRHFVLNCRSRFETPLSDKVVKKRGLGDIVAFGQIRTSDATQAYKYRLFLSLRGDIN
jgi:hypothetical protein